MGVERGWALDGLIKSVRALRQSNCVLPTPGSSAQPTVLGGLRALIAVVGIFLSCLSSPVFADTLVIPGSGNPEYILGVLAASFNTQQSVHTVVVPTTIGTAGALREIAEGRASMGRIGRPLKGAEREQGYSYFSLGRDPIVFVGGAGVSVRNITRDQVLGIYSGQIVNWQSLGGRAQVIRAVGREITDASYLGIVRHFERFEGVQYADTVKVVHLDSQLLELLDRFPGSFGFLNRTAILAAKTKLVPLALDGVEANHETIAAGLYPMWTEIGLIYKEKHVTDAGLAFLRFISSVHGQEILRTHGLVLAQKTPLPAHAK